MRSLSERPWFRRRRIGFGWYPVRWQGWLVSGTALVLIVIVLVLLHGSSARVPVTVLIVALYAAVALTTGGRRHGSGGSAWPAPPPGDELPPPAEATELRTPAAARARPPRTQTGAPVLVVDHLSKRFGERVAVDDVSFSVDAGEVFGFLGPNGAGKTTTVRMLGTLIAPTSGSAVVAGLALEPANGVAIRQRIAVMPENPGLYLRLTVAENLAFFAGLYGLKKPDARIERALEAVNLRGRAHDACGSLSKGLRQRVGLARTLLADPAIVFLDEPTSGLDPLATREVLDLIDGLRSRGVTVFLTTHRLEEAERLCDRVAIMNTNLRTIGRPAELRDRLFAKKLVLTTAAPIETPEHVLAGVTGVEGWRTLASARYELDVDDTRRAAPALARALVAADVDILSLAEEQHSLEDVYLELIDDDVEARR